MNILYATLKANSGADVTFQRIAESVRDSGLFGIDEFPLYVGHQPTNIVSTFKNYNIETKLSLYNSSAFSLLLPREFIKECQEYDIIHSNADYGTAFKVKDKLFVVSLLHIVNPKSGWLSPLQKVYYSWVSTKTERALREADYVVAISKYTEYIVKELYPNVKDKIKTIHLGVDISKFTPNRSVIDCDGKIKLLFVGNLTKRKGADLLPRIMEKLNNDFVLFYTSGLRTKDKLYKDYNTINIGKIDVEKMPKVYNDKCDILLMPSRLEGFGFSACEAMACGKPVVATNCSSIPELVNNGKGGFLCEMDNVNDFVDKIKILAYDKKLREEMGIYNRQKVVEKFDLKNMGREYAELYRSFE